MSASKNYRCELCPHRCLIADGGRGLCEIRENSGGSLSLPFNGILSAVSSDPVEKKPLYHYYPGYSIYSIGFFGCNLRCPFCQNHHISRNLPSLTTRKMTPEQTAQAAADSGCFGIAYTYSEPLIHFEWVLETAERAAALGLKNVLVTNGYINEIPADLLLDRIDALNVDLKSFNDEFYRRELGGSLAPVKAFIRKAREHAHLEVTTLIVPGKNDSIGEIAEAADFLSGIDPDIPWHLSAYYPAYKYRTAPTEAESLMSLAAKAAEKMTYVYTGNINGGRIESRCPDCGFLLISRNGYNSIPMGFRDGCCKNCGKDLSGAFIVP